MPASGERGVAARLRTLGLELPDPPRPLGRYLAALPAGDVLSLSGMLPLEHGRPALTGRLGESVSVEQAQAAARLALLNGLSAAGLALGGLDRLRRVLRLGVALATTPEFSAHAAVADGASELLGALFDEGHTRFAFGVQSLPLGVPLVLDLTFELHSETRA